MNPTTDTSWQRLRKLVRKRDESKCYHCGIIVENGHCDHLIPLSRGGTDAINNLVWSCKKCNLAKGNKMPKYTIYKLKQEVQPSWKNVFVSIPPFLTGLLIPPYPSCESPEFHDEFHLFRQNKIKTWIREHLWPMSPGLVKSIEYDIQSNKFFDMLETASKNYIERIK